MNWEAVGSIAEAIGATAVLVTLIYLATQVRHARDQISRSARQVRDATLRDLYLATAQSPELARVVGKATDGWTPDIESEEQLFKVAEFTSEERIIWRNYNRAWWSYFGEAVANRQDLTPSQLQEVDRGIVLTYSGSPAATYFNSMSAIDSPTVRYVREIIESNGKSTAV